MPNTVVILTQPANVSAVIGQDLTFSVTPSANFTPTSYYYQWKFDGTNISGANAQTYMRDVVLSDSTKSVVVGISAMLPTAVVGVLSATATAITSGSTLTITADAFPYNVFQKGKEDGRTRFKRLRHLGYV